TGTTCARCCAAARTTARWRPRSMRCGAGAPTATRSCGRRRPWPCPRSRCPTSAADAVNARNEPYRPLLTNAARPATYDVTAVDEHGEARTVAIAGEHPLTLYVDKRELVTIM